MRLVAVGIVVLTCVACVTTESTTSETRYVPVKPGETNLKFGLSEKVGFEVTLIRAIENCRARAIDTLIREISGLASTTEESTGDESEKKKSRLSA